MPAHAPDRTSLPLHGIRVVDFGHYIAGPATALILADLGATVVHVDPPSGPRWESPANATLNRGKLVTTLDLKTQDGVAQAAALIAAADVVIENFRPGTMARLGLDLAAAREADPALVTVSIPGFASDDAERRTWRAFEPVIAAASGVYTDMGLNRVLMGVNPSFSPLPLASAYGTMLAAAACVLALQARQATGRGDGIEVPLACAIMEGLCYNSIEIANYPRRYMTQREQEIERRRSEGLPMDLDYDALQELLDPFYRSYRCKDGRLFYVVCPSHRRHARRCLEALGLYDALVAEGLGEQPDTYLPVAEWSADVSLGVYPLPKHWADRIAARMKPVFLTRTAAEWERVFGDGRFPGAPQRWLQEWIADPHAHAAGLMIGVDDPALGPMIQPGPLAWLEESAATMLHPAPRRTVPAEEAIAALAALPATAPAVADAPAAGGWLEGVRVLDLCNVIAGPHATATLARFGATVIKLDPAIPLYDSWNTVVFGLTHMRGKRSVLADIQAPEGRAVFERLVRSVDVVVWNATDRQVASMGLDAAGLQALNPGAIFCQLDCFGGVRTGPRTDDLGYDDLVQAATGIMLRFGGGMDTPEEHAHVGTIDVMCGFGAALGIAAALYQKARIGTVGRARTSLSALSGLAQIPFCFDHAGRGPFDEPSGRDARGFDSLTRIYATASGPALLLAASEADLPRLDRVEGLAGLAAVAAEARTAWLEAAFPNAPTMVWLARLRAADIGAAACAGIAAVRAAHTRTADGTPGTDRGSYAFSAHPDHPSGHAVTQLDPYAIRPQRAPVCAPEPAEHYGASTRSVLRGIGYGDAEIDALVACGAVSECWSREYLPS